MVDTTTLPELLPGRPLTHQSIFESYSAGRRLTAAENSDAEVPR